MEKITEITLQTWGWVKSIKEFYPVTLQQTLFLNEEEQILAQCANDLAKYCMPSHLTDGRNYLQLWQLQNALLSLTTLYTLPQMTFSTDVVDFWSALSTHRWSTQFQLLVSCIVFHSAHSFILKNSAPSVVIGIVSSRLIVWIFCCFFPGALGFDLKLFVFCWMFES